jgi:hypothetical protein
MADIDNDGDLDLLIVDPHFLFLNQGDGTFADQTSRSGIAGPSWTMSSADYDGDGFVDVWSGGTDHPGRVFRNRGNDHHWLRVELVAPGATAATLGRG